MGLISEGLDYEEGDLGAGLKYLMKGILKGLSITSRKPTLSPSPMFPIKSERSLGYVN